MKKGFEPSKEGYEHDDLEAEMREAKEAAEAKYGHKVRLALALRLLGRALS